MIALLMVMLASTAAGDEVVDDVVFVQTDTAGVYHGRSGSIIALTPSYVVLRSPDGDHLFARDAVHRVVMSGTTVLDDRTFWPTILRTYWNSDRSPLVKAVQAFPIVGQPLRVLDNIPTSIASLLATIALCLALLWASYKAYELTIVSRDTQRLNRLRLQLEIAKIRNEALDLSRRLTFRDSAVLEALDLPLPEPPQREEPGSAGRRWSSNHGRFARIFMSAPDRADQRSLYETEAALVYKRGTSRAKWARIRRLGWLAIGVIFAGFYSLALLMGSIGMFLPAEGSSGPEDATAAVVLLVLGVFLTRQTGRLVLKLRDIRRAYAFASPPSSTVIEEIIGTA